MARLLSVNVGLPRDIAWKGRMVHTGIWKYPVAGRCRAGRLNLDGDGQGDPAGHGGEQRAVLACQIEAYRHWEAALGKKDFVYGQFGENFTIEGLADATVRIGDRYRIGTAVFEVTQPRVTCYRVGIRTNEPRMPALLTSSGLPGFYLRVLAMLHALSDSHSTRPIVGLHAARDGQHHPFAAEARGLVRSLAHGSSHVCYSRPGALDQEGRDFDTLGHLSPATLAALDVLPAADVYLCGPPAFMTDMNAALASLHVTPAHIHAEIFNGGASLTPGIAAAAARAPHPPQDETGTGPLISFARSGIAAHWNPSAYQSILELAEACDVPVRWSCRAGVCHNCESGLVSGTVTYHPDPLDPPAASNVLICCARPQGDVVVDI